MKQARTNWLIGSIKREIVLKIGWNEKVTESTIDETDEGNASGGNEVRPGNAQPGLLHSAPPIVADESEE